MLEEGRGKVGRVYNGLPHYAEVTVRVHEKDGSNISVRCDGDPRPVSQGYIEDVPAAGYDDWKQGAEIGAQYALDTANQSGLSVIITRILGMTTDTNPSVVGAATVYAVWQALGYSPTPEQAEHLVRVISGSWRRPPEALPDFAD